MEIKVLHQVMEWNEDVSAEVRRTLKDHKVCLINVMGSPGAGKTSLITALIAKLREEFAIGVIEGDITGQIDAEKIAALKIPAVQLNTDGACHIEAMSIQKILPGQKSAAIAVGGSAGHCIDPPVFPLAVPLSGAKRPIKSGVPLQQGVQRVDVVFVHMGCQGLGRREEKQVRRLFLHQPLPQGRLVPSKGLLFQLDLKSQLRTGQSTEPLGDPGAGRRP